MTGGKDHPNSVIAEKIIIVRVFAAQKLPVYPRLVEVLPDIGRKPIWIEGILLLDPLHEVSRPREVANGAGVVEMEVRLQDVAHVFRPHVDTAQLVNTIVGSVHDKIVGVERGAPMPPGVDRASTALPPSITTLPRGCLMRNHGTGIS
jgi:hypothetical protein